MRRKARLSIALAAAVLVHAAAAAQPLSPADLERANQHYRKAWDLLRAEAFEDSIAEFQKTIDIDNRHGEAGARQEMGEAGSFNPRMNVRACLAGRRVGREHRRAKAWQAVAPGDRSKQEAARLESQMQRGSGEREVVCGVEQTNCQAKIEAVRFERQRLEIGALPTGALGHQRTGINHLGLS